MLNHFKEFEEGPPKKEVAESLFHFLWLQPKKNGYVAGKTQTLGQPGSAEESQQRRLWRNHRAVTRKWEEQILSPPTLYARDTLVGAYASNADPDEDDIDQKFSMKLSECKIPDTLVFEAGSPVAWYKSSSAGAVIRKGMGMLEERLISEFTKPSHFAVGSGKVGEGGPSRNSIGVEVRATWLQFSSKVKKMKKESTFHDLMSPRLRRRRDGSTKRPTSDSEESDDGVGSVGLYSIASSQRIRDPREILNMPEIYKKVLEWKQRAVERLKKRKTGRSMYKSVGASGAAVHTAITGKDEEYFETAAEDMSNTRNDLPFVTLRGLKGVMKRIAQDGSSGILQRFVLPRTERNDTIQAVWTSKEASTSPLDKAVPGDGSVVITVRTNKHLLRKQLDRQGNELHELYKRCVTFEQPTDSNKHANTIQGYYSSRTLSHSSTLSKKIIKTCKDVAAHIEEQSASRKVQLRKMILHFKKDHNGQLWLLWSDCLQFSSPKMAKPKSKSEKEKSSSSKIYGKKRPEKRVKLFKGQVKVPAEKRNFQRVVDYGGDGVAVRRSDGKLERLTIRSRANTHKCDICINSVKNGDYFRIRNLTIAHDFEEATHGAPLSTPRDPAVLTSEPQISVNKLDLTNVPLEASSMSNHKRGMASSKRSGALEGPLSSRSTAAGLEEAEEGYSDDGEGLGDNAAPTTLAVSPASPTSGLVVPPLLHRVFPKLTAKQYRSHRIQPAFLHSKLFLCPSCASEELKIRENEINLLHLRLRAEQLQQADQNAAVARARLEIKEEEEKQDARNGQDENDANREAKSAKGRSGRSGDKESTKSLMAFLDSVGEDFHSLRLPKAQILHKLDSQARYYGTGSETARSAGTSIGDKSSTMRPRARPRRAQTAGPRRKANRNAQQNRDISRGQRKVELGHTYEERRKFALEGGGWNNSTDASDARLWHQRRIEARRKLGNKASNVTGIEKMFGRFGKKKRHGNTTYSSVYRKELTRVEGVRAFDEGGKAAYAHGSAHQYFSARPGDDRIKFNSKFLQKNKMSAFSQPFSSSRANSSSTRQGKAYSAETAFVDPSSTHNSPPPPRSWKNKDPNDYVVPPKFLDINQMPYSNNSLHSRLSNRSPRNSGNS